MSKLTAEQRARLLDAHRAGGIAASRPLAREFGCSEGYAKLLAYNAGDTPKRPARSRPNDPRWKLAIERGSISA